MSAVMSNILPGPAHHAPSALEAAQAALASAENSADVLKLSELRYRRLFEAARDGILLLDSDRGRITDANPFMTELLGYSHEEMLGKQLWEIGLLRDKGASQEAFRQLEQQGYIRYENLPLRTRNGERREVEFVSNLYREDGHTVIQCNIRDITERKRMDAELVAAAAKNERIAETLQRSMLLAPPPGKFPGVLVETCYMAALNEAELGGDFFDAFALAGGKVALGRLNDFICETHRLDTDNQEAFIVLALVVMDTLTGEAAFLAAGAEPTLILRANGTAEPVEIIGLSLGIQSGVRYMAVAALLASRETVLMATDGITEARRGKAFLGTQGMAALAEKAGPTASLPELSQAICAGARDFADTGLRDDVCLLLARRQ